MPQKLNRDVSSCKIALLLIPPPAESGKRVEYHPTHATQFCLQCNCINDTLLKAMFYFIDFKYRPVHGFDIKLCSTLQVLQTAVQSYLFGLNGVIYWYGCSIADLNCLV